MIKQERFSIDNLSLFPGIHEAIVDQVTWKMVQNKLEKPDKSRTVIDEAIPFRGILKCHCDHPLTGAAFDSNLYYENGSYRTPAMMPLLSHNTIKMKQLELLIFQKI